jgi:TonB family protein
MSVALVLALALAAPSAADGHVITHPDWDRVPNPQDLAVRDAAPSTWDGSPGSATLECRVNDLGLLGHCKVLSADPPDRGFGRWALDIAHLFKMKPETVDGKPVSHAMVRIPVHFGAGSPTIYGDGL